jgi:DNA-binding CsgD family transcriptional regulator
MARPHQLTAADRAAIVDLYRDGHSTWCVAKRTRLSQPTIRYHLKSASVEMRHQPSGRFVALCCPAVDRQAEVTT